MSATTATLSDFAPPQATITPTDRLSVMLFFAVCAHLIVVLGVTFVKEDRPLSTANSLDVVLVQRKSEKAPDDADFLGQANQEGGGEQPEVIRPSTPLPSPLLANKPELAAASPPVTPSVPVQAEPLPAPEADVAPPPPVIRPQTVVAVADVRTAERVPLQPAEPVAEKTPEVRKAVRKARPQQKVAKAAPAPKAPRAQDPAPRPAPQAEAAPVQTIDAAALVRRSLAMASLSAEVNKRMEAYAKRPRRRWISARTRESKYAAYMEAWRAKVERVGNLNYPDEARRRRLSGDLLLEVALKADGSVSAISISRSSGHKVLDDAAVRIVRLAAPFARFPKAIRDETDILHISRTWRFLTGDRFASR